MAAIYFSVSPTNLLLTAAMVTLMNVAPDSFATACWRRKVDTDSSHRRKNAPTHTQPSCKRGFVFLHSKSLHIENMSLQSTHIVFRPDCGLSTHLCSTCLSYTLPRIGRGWLADASSVSNHLAHPPHLPSRVLINKHKDPYERTMASQLSTATSLGHPAANNYASHKLGKVRIHDTSVSAHLREHRFPCPRYPTQKNASWWAQPMH